MSSRTTLFAKREDLKKFADNVAQEFHNTNSRSYSVALCFDALLTVLDQRRKNGTPKISDQVKALLEKLPKQAEEAPKDANPPSNEG